MKERSKELLLLRRSLPAPPWAPAIRADRLRWTATPSVGYPTELGQWAEGPNSWLATYNGPTVPAKAAPDGENHYGRDNTYGGYSNVIVVNEDFALRIPPALRPEVAPPILCAGVTTYSPMKHWGVKPGDRVGIIGFGGLGDMAAKLAKAMGAEVTVFTSHQDKLEPIAAVGARGVVENDAGAITDLKSSFDFILSTIPREHDLNP